MLKDGVQRSSCWLGTCAHDFRAICGGEVFQLISHYHTGAGVFSSLDPYSGKYRVK
jgi:hypothetical protein